MSGRNEVILPPDLSELVSAREKIWAEVDKAQGLSAELGKLSSQVPQCAPAELQLQLGAASTPITELETVLPLLKTKIARAHKLNTEVKVCHDQIEAIKRREKTIIVIAAVTGVVLLFVLLLIGFNLFSAS
jgi:hypothetical protein